jgi:cytochrome c peroxidase
MRALKRPLLAAMLIVLAAVGPPATAHIVPPERLDSTAEGYRLLAFLLGLNPVSWDQVAAASEAVAEGLAPFDAAQAASYRAEVARLIDGVCEGSDGGPLPRPQDRRAAAQRIVELSAGAVTRVLKLRLAAAQATLGQPATAARHLDEARQVWAAFEHEVRATDPRGYRRIGECWLELAEALGSPGVLGVGAVPPSPEVFAQRVAEVTRYVEASFAGPLEFRNGAPLTVVPAHSPTFDAAASVPPKLPPRSELNKQLPRPRQILNMTARGVDESETVLIALGDMAFDSPLVFGEPARSFGISCNTCHNKGVTNPQFFVPGLSARPGGLDVSNSFFAPHASNGHFDPLDIPDLRGIRFTAPYGRNGRFDSLREFTRNVIVNEFNGPEPTPVLLDAMVAYMLEFDFLPNPRLGPGGTLDPSAGEAALRGQAIFNRPFPQMDGRSCATCHVPSDSFVDRKRHDIGTMRGSDAHSRDRALDTPTLLGIRHTPPYLHDGSAPTLHAVVERFDALYGLGLAPGEVDDLTAYLEAVGDGVEAHEDTLHTLASEMEEFQFFLSAYEVLRARNETVLIETTLGTVAGEIRAHKWDAQDRACLPVLERMAELMDEATGALRAGDLPRADARVAEYRRLYLDNVERLR